MQGLAVLLTSALTLLYAAVTLGLIYCMRGHWVIRYSQPLFCSLFTLGCAVLAIAAVLKLGGAKDMLCYARPATLHVSCISVSNTCMLISSVEC